MKLINKSINENNFYFDEIDSIECLGNFNDETVYDIEVDDETHTFIVNDMLVHNSGYLIFEEVMDAVNWEGTKKDFVLAINKHRLKEFFEKILSDYADAYGVENYLVFELESIAENAIWVAKKKYIQNIVWKDGKEYDELTNIKTTGLELIQSSTPIFARTRLIELMKFIFSKGKLTPEHTSELIMKIKDIKNEFMLADIEQISMNTGISKYSKYVLKDTDELVFEKGCPVHVRGGGYHNYLINNNEKLKKKYELIGAGNKVKWYYSTDPFCNVFSFKSGYRPYEIAPPVDYERQFTRAILSPLNRIISPAGMDEINYSLAYTAGALF